MPTLLEIAPARVPTVSRQLKEYLTGKVFQRQVVRAYERYEVLSEGALRTLVVRLLRAKLKRIGVAAREYRVTCEDFLLADRAKPDILLWKGRHPRFWIELKDTRVARRSAAQADWDKLAEHCPKYKTIKGGFLVYVFREGAQDSLMKRTKDTRRLWSVSIRLKDFIKDDFEAWDAEYARRAHYIRAVGRC
jgi:hypothetical protein